MVPDGKIVMVARAVIMAGRLAEFTYFLKVRTSSSPILFLLTKYLIDIHAV